MSARGMPWSSARSTIFFATSKRTSGSSEIPVSSLEIATTAAPCFFTRGRTDSSRSSSPVTEFTSALPSYTPSPASSAATMDESIDRGTSVTDCTSFTARASRAGSSASGMPALTSSMCAPACTWARASASTREKSSAAISAASTLRPVGLMRSPMTTNGRSKPMATSRCAELTTVSVKDRSRRAATAGALARRFRCSEPRAPRPTQRTDEERSVPCRRNSRRAAALAARHAERRAPRMLCWRAMNSLAVSTATAASRQYASAPTASANCSLRGAPPTSTV